MPDKMATMTITTMTSYSVKPHFVFIVFNADVMGSPQFIGERIPGDVEDKGIRRSIYIGHLTPRACLFQRGKTSSVAKNRTNTG
jgi:hypothetical protein